MRGDAGQRVVLLDRDGTLIVERNYLRDPAQVELLPGAGQALYRLQQMGLPLVVVTNQSGVGRGMFTLDDVQRVHQRLHDLLAEHQVRLSGIYCCPHIEQDDCHCRKPRTGMVEQAAAELGFDPRRSIVVGDKALDIELGQRLGAVTLLVRTGYGRQTEAAGKCEPDHIVDDLSAAAALITQWS